MPWHIFSEKKKNPIGNTKSIKQVFNAELGGWKGGMNLTIRFGLVCTSSIENKKKKEKKKKVIPCQACQP
jgi:hypothetical protein